MDNTSQMSYHFAGILADGWKSATFGPFREGVEICHLRDADPAVALLKYAPGAKVPLHLHTGLETILVLAGSQSDEWGTYQTGDLVLNPEGTTHSVRSEDGCVVLISWERPVKILDEDDT